MGMKKTLLLETLMIIIVGTLYYILEPLSVSNVKGYNNLSLVYLGIPLSFMELPMKILYAISLNSIYPFSKDVFLLVAWIAGSFIIGILSREGPGSGAKLGALAPFYAIILLYILNWLFRYSGTVPSLMNYFTNLVTVAVISSISGYFGGYILRPKQQIFVDPTKFGTDLPIACPHCGFKMYSNAFFCSVCGTQLVEELPPELK